MGLISRVSSRTYRVKKIMANETMTLRGTLEGHGGWVTQVVTNPKFPDLLLSSSRDKSLIMWKLNRTDSQYGFPQKRLTGHNHFVSDVVVSSCGQFAVSSSWDKTLRLWDLEHSTCTTKFNGHTADVLSVAFSADNRQIISCGRDKTIKLWNTLGEFKWTQDKTNKSSHSEWVSTVKFSPTAQNPVIVSGAWDKQIKVWDLSDNASNNPLHTLEAGEEINKLIFSPNRYWLCAACGTSIKIWDLEHKTIVQELAVESISEETGKNSAPAKVLSLCWSTDGQTLFAGYTDGLIRVFEITSSQ